MNNTDALPARNKARMLELIERVNNGHDLAALPEFTANPSVIGSASGLVNAFPDLAVDVDWIIAEADTVTAYLTLRGTHLGPWIWVQEPTGLPMASGLILALKFDPEGQIIDQWVGANFVGMLAQLGWGVAPIGETVQLPA
jgi:predicted ester cyclase